MKYKIYIINLKKDQDRRVFMTEQMEELWLSYEFVDWVYGKEYQGDEYSPDLSLKYSNELFAPNVVGCALSHKRCYQKMLSDKVEYAVIVEDDLLINVKDFWQILEDEIEKNELSFQQYWYSWEYLQLSYNMDKFTNLLYTIYFSLYLKCKTDWRNIFRYSVYKDFFSQFFDYFCIIIVRKFKNRFFHWATSAYKHAFVTASCYIINTQGATKLLDLSQNIIYSADMIQEYARRKWMLYKYYIPSVWFQYREKFGSNIDPLKLDDEVDTYGRRVLKKKWYSVW